VSIDVEGGILLLSFDSNWSKVHLIGPAIILDSQEFSL